MKYSVLGVCAGNGAVLFPFKDNLIGNIEPRSVFKYPRDAQWKANFPIVSVYQNFFDWRSDCDYRQPDVIIGHPDCGHSSVLAYSRGKKFKDPKENKSLEMFISAIVQYKPKVFLMENLPALLATYPGLISIFGDYNCITYCDSVSKWGNSQVSRKRLVVIGVRKDIECDLSRVFRLPKQENIHLSYFGALVEGLDERDEALCHVRLHSSERIAMFGGCQMTLKEIRRGWQANPGARRWKTGEEKMINAPGVYRNLSNKLPLTVRKGNREFNNEGKIMTPRERARVQGIPDEFNLVYYPDKLKFSINKANITATKCFPYEIALWFQKCLKRMVLE